MPLATHHSLHLCHLPLTTRPLSCHSIHSHATSSTTPYATRHLRQPTLPRFRVGGSLIAFLEISVRRVRHTPFFNPSSSSRSTASNPDIDMMGVQPPPPTLPIPNRLRAISAMGAVRAAHGCARGLFAPASLHITHPSPPTAVNIEIPTYSIHIYLYGRPLSLLVLAGVLLPFSSIPPSTTLLPLMSRNSTINLL